MKRKFSSVKIYKPLYDKLWEEANRQQLTLTQLIDSVMTTYLACIKTEKEVEESKAQHMKEMGIKVLS